MMSKNTIRKAMAWAAAFVMLFGLAPASAPAEGSTRVTILPTDGTVYSEFIVEADDGTEPDVEFADGMVTVNSGKVYIRNADGVTVTTDRIVVAGNAEVVLAGVNIAPGSTAAPALRVNPGVTATITLEDENTLTGGNGYAGLEVGWESGDSYAHVTIGGSGKLTAAGGGGSGGAGIGGSKENGGVYGDITINGGTIIATGTNGGAGIGSSNNPWGGSSHGSYKHTDEPWGTITINGGDITATGAGNGAGIGGGNHVDSGEIIINDGTINARGDSGIGSGLGSSKPNDNGVPKGPGYYCAYVTIHGGNITAYATNNMGAGIGGGMYGDAYVTITGGTINASVNPGGNAYQSGAGIGGGYQGEAVVVITGGDITATGGTAGPGIGNGALGALRAEGKGDIRTGAPAIATGDSRVSISGGAVVRAYGGTHGAGIGSGNACDECNVEISGGTVLAVGGKSSADVKQGAAGIGSGSYYSSNKPSYKQYTDVHVSITGGTVTAIGGWGAAGIGSGADNKMAESISITGGDVQAYADGTKFAIDTRVVSGDTTTSRTEGRNVTVPVIQGTFVHAYTSDDTNQNPEGLASIVITNDSDGSAARELKKMPASYRSFAATVFAAGTYNVYTAEASIGEGEGRYFAEAQRDTWDEDELDNVIGFEVTGSALSDHYYLYPVKSFIVTKKLATAEGTDLSGLNTVIDVQLVRQGTGDVQDSGSIEIAGGVPQNRVVFVNVPDNKYEIWEMNGGKRMAAGTVTGEYELRKIETQDSSGSTTNNGEISDEKWTDSVTLVNTYRKVTKISVSGEKTWDDQDNKDGIRPKQITVNLLADGKKADSKTVTAGSDGRWTYTFSGLKEYNGDKKIAYTVSEEAVDGYTAAYDGMNIVNRHVPEPEKISVSGEKTWDDGNNQDGIRPAQITVDLLADGKKADSRTVTAGSDGRWTYTFSGLDKYDGDKEIAYTVSEEAVAGYTAEYNGMNIVNRHIPETRDISGVKTWADQNDAEGKRPNSITVRLLADGAEAASKQVTAADGWKYSFTGLPRYKDGKEIVYTLKENPVAGYNTVITGFNVTNTLKVVKEDPPEVIHRLTVRYWYEQVDGQTAHPTFTGLYKEGVKYRVNSPAIHGWTVDLKSVRGTMGTEDIIVDVIYTRNPYHLTIHYVDLYGTTMAPDYTDTLYTGDGYHVESPVIEGYRTQTPLVAGMMPARDLVITVIYYPETIVHRRVRQVVFEEYDTPLGVGSQSMDVGECIE